MKKAIVLLMTLGFISIISALVLWSLNISKDRFDKIVYIDAENQFGIVFKDFVKIINQNTKEINSTDDLDNFLSIGMPAIAEAKTQVGLGFIVESKMDKLNINYILSTLVAHEANDTRNEDDDYLLRPLVRYFRDKHELSNPDLMFDFLLDSVDKDDMERGSETEIANEDIDFEQGKIYSFNHLKKIFNKYYQESRDKRVFNISRSEFEEYFYFGDIKQGMFDSGRCGEGCSDCKAMELLVEDGDTIEPQNEECSEIFKDRKKDDQPMEETLKEIKKIYNISQFNNKSKYLVKCIVTFDTSEYRRDISFDYDIGSAGVENIDKNFQEEE
jgi:hypothetical protein